MFIVKFDMMNYYGSLDNLIYDIPDAYHRVHRDQYPKVSRTNNSNEVVAHLSMTCSSRIDTDTLENIIQTYVSEYKIKKQKEV